MNLHGLDAIIFDFDGVLVESVDVKTRAFVTLYAEHGEDVMTQVKDYHLRHGGKSRFDKFRHFQTEILGKPPLDDREVSELAASFSELVVDQIVAAPMVNGAQEFLDSCRKDMSLFVVSGTPTSELDEILKQRHLREYFIAIWGSPGTKSQHISELLREHEICANRCVMIGDSMTDYSSAVFNSVKFLGRVAGDINSPFSDDVETFVDFTRLPAAWLQA